jgi:hypothetical protein
MRRLRHPPSGRGPPPLRVLGARRFLLVPLPPTGNNKDGIFGVVGVAVGLKWQNPKKVFRGEGPKPKMLDLRRLTE